MKLKIIIAFFILTGSSSCKKTVVEPDPSQVISGTYTAKTYVSFETQDYPINGQTITLQIDPIAKDSVRVQINSTPNGFYSPGEPTTYEKVFVKKQNTGFNYVLTLAPPVYTGGIENTISFDRDNKPYYAYYIYVPPGYDKGAVETIFIPDN